MGPFNFPISLLPSVCPLAPVHSARPRVPPSGSGTTIPGWPAQPRAVALPKCTGTGFDGISPAAWPARLSRGQAAGGSSQTFVHPSPHAMPRFSLTTMSTRLFCEATICANSYWSLLLEEVVEIATSEPNTAQPTDSYVTSIAILPDEDATPSASSPPD